MQKIKWTDDFSVGIPIFDKHHRTIVSLLNDLIEHPDMKTSSEEFHSLLQELLHYTLYHLKYEEELMEKSGHDTEKYRNHVAEHDSFIEKVTDFSAGAMDHQPGLPLLVLTFLKDWLQHHILVVDKEYADDIYLYLYGDRAE